MTAKLSELSLRHVDASKLLLQRTDMMSEPSWTPEWFERASSGSFGCLGWYNGSVLATVETKTKHKLYVAVVAVSGLFANDEQMKGPGREKDDSSVLEATDEELEDFSRRAVADIYPFLRQELYQLTGHFHGLPGVMLQPDPTLGPRQFDPRRAERDPASEESAAPSNK